MFQSYNSPIKSHNLRRSFSNIYRFQSYNSPIKSMFQGFYCFLRISFNPTIVRLKEFKLVSFGNLKQCFNPTIVRLKDSNSLIQGNIINAFQSYNSPIKSLAIVFFMIATSSFQSYNSPIKSVQTNEGLYSLKYVSILQ